MKALLPLRALVSCWVLTQCLLLPLSVQAQEDGGPPLPDGGVFQLPDASTPPGGSDGESEEDEDNTGRPGGACRSTLDCPTRFSCSQGTCRYTGIRQAERVGCLLAPENGLAVVGLGVVIAARRRGGGK